MGYEKLKKSKKRLNKFSKNLILQKTRRNMIIQLIAENEQEENRLGGEQKEISGVNEYLFFGNRADEDEHHSEFHEWHGNHKYLMTNLQWFYEVVNDERKIITSASGNRMIKRSTLPQNVETLGVNKNSNTIKFPQEEDAEEIPEPPTLDDE